MSSVSICHSVCQFISTVLSKYSDWLTIRNEHGILIFSMIRVKLLSASHRNYAGCFAKWANTEDDKLLIFLLFLFFRK